MRFGHQVCEDFRIEKAEFALRGFSRRRVTVPRGPVDGDAAPMFRAEPALNRFVERGEENLSSDIEHDCAHSLAPGAGAC